MSSQQGAVGDHRAVVPVRPTAGVIERRPNALLGMIWLDLLGMRRMVRSIGVLMIVLAVTAGLLKQFAVGLPMLLTAMSALGSQLFSSDEYYGLGRLYGSLPVSRSTVINARYLIVAGSVILVGAGVCVLVLFEPGALLFGLVPVVTCVMALHALIVAAQIPVVVRFGARNGVWALVGFFILVTAVGYLFYRGQRDDPERLLALLQRVVDHPGPVTALAISITVISLVTSWALVQRIYRAQDH